MVRAFGPPSPPPQAPQLWAESCGLFWLCEPCPCSSKSRANPRVSPMSRSTRSAASIISATLKPTPSPVGPGLGAARSMCRRVSSGVWTRRPNLWRICAVNRGKRMRASSGNEARIPSAPRHDRAHGKAAAAFVKPQRNRSQHPAGLRLGGGRRAPSSLCTSSVTQIPGRITTGQRGVK